MSTFIESHHIVVINSVQPNRKIEKEKERKKKKKKKRMGAGA